MHQPWYSDEFSTENEELNFLAASGFHEVMYTCVDGKFEFASRTYDQYMSQRIEAVELELFIVPICMYIWYLPFYVKSSTKLKSYLWNITE